MRGNKAGTKKYCKDCAGYVPQERKIIKCIDCGKEIVIPSLNTKTCRCENCQLDREKLLKAERNKRYYNKLRR